ncbi:cupin domain-containing protein [Phaeobacter sp. 22II1-1F12B]|uniref:cupin domain-containing protein n=1 Tax=Phaeobacter sp. 22II1-1F12B TaxID=1317111 RepID=UPI000B626281|nr:cupin domain-containing protein [Phaeobacter sp. 22II1-1F12B]OWU81619.1 cupin [Phaeobacter sp. 22II1-1F12B]
MRAAAKATQMIDDDRVRVTRFDFEPGAETGWHQHGMDYVVTTLTDCTMELEDPDGSSRVVEMAAGTSYRRSSGVHHNVINGGDRPMAFVEVELK